MTVVYGRTRVRALRQPVLVAIALLLLIAVPAFAAKFCALPVGAASRDATWEAIQPLLPELRRLAGDRKFVLITRPNFGDISRHEAAYRRGYHEAAASQLLERYGPRRAAILADPAYASDKRSFSDGALVSRIYSLHEGRYSKEFIRVVLNRSRPLISEEMSELRANAARASADPLSYKAEGKTHELTYIYTNDPASQRAIGMSGIERGVMLETSGGELARALAADSPLIEKLDRAELVFLDRIDLDQTQILERQGRPLIRLPSMRHPQYRQLAQLVHGSGQAQHVPFNLLPRTRSDARIWGFDAEKADAYAVAHGRMASKLRRAGFREQGSGLGAAALAAAIEAEVAAGRRPVIIGEGMPDGKAVRLPGTAQAFDPATLSEAARRATWFIFCNSAASPSATDGFSIVGRIWTRDAGNLVATLSAGGRAPNSKETVSERTEWIVDFAAFAGGASTVGGGRLISVLCFESPDPTITCPVPPRGD
ncbi:hypothetical protein [Sphingosinicella sp. BN140058]|uniref:hypothetical protein n=1 Tax=Sphingosinicella sp. BN140058 TaxID=1892855 RepID=UPI0010111A8A|nr:hypothetical protein [Sphingosinicella sp. BN140058]QAY80274.1 hypothetical protein ETR14_26890 [Sphingosinicella sp. BN140058]